MDIHLISKEIILNHLHLGMMPSFLELQDITDLLNNNTSWTKISVPKDMKMFELREYVSKCINIPEKFILLYTYVLRDQRNIYKNILKRHDFKMHLIEENAMREQKISTINLYNETKSIFKSQIFIFIDFALKNPEQIYMKYSNEIRENNQLLNQLKKLELKIFERNELYEIEKEKIFEDITETEYILDESQQKMIYYKFDNYWKFKKQEDISDNLFKLLKYKNNDYDNFKLFIIKDFVHSNGEARIKILNSFSIPVVKNSDKYIIQNIISYTKNNNKILHFIENIENDEFKQFNIDFYLETTVFDQDTSVFLKKLIYLNHKKEKLFYQNLKKKRNLGKNAKVENMNINLMEFEYNENSITNNFQTKKKTIKKNLFFNQMKKEKFFNDKLITLDDKNSSKIHQDISISSNDENKRELLPNSNKKEKNQIYLKYRRDIKDKNKSLNDDMRGNDNNCNYIKSISSENKTLSQDDDLNFSPNTNKSEKFECLFSENKNINNSFNSLKNQKNENINSKENNFIKEINEKYSENKLLNSPSDNNSMANNKDSFSDEQVKKKNFTKQLLCESKKKNLNKTDKCLKIKNYRKSLGNNRNNHNNKNITYQNLSNYNQSQENNCSNWEINNNGNILINSPIKYSNNIINEESNESFTQEDILNIQQEFSPLDDFLFKLLTLSNDKINDIKFNLNNWNSDLSDEDICEFKSNSNKNINWEFKYINKINEPYIDNNFYCAFSKSNSDALILYIMAEESNRLFAIDEMYSKNSIFSFLENEHNSVYIPVIFFFGSNYHQFNNHFGSNKFKLRLDDDYELIKNKIFDFFSYNLKYYNLDQIFYQDEITKNILFFTEKKELLKLPDFLERVNTDFIFIRPTINLDQISNNNSTFIQNIFSKYELLKYMDSKDSLYKLSVFLFPFKIKNNGNLMNKDITLYDIDNNPITKINFCFPSEFRECSDYLHYIKDVLKKFYIDIYDSSEDQDEIDQNYSDDNNYFNLNKFPEGIKNKGILESKDKSENKLFNQFQYKKEELIEIIEENKIEISEANNDKEKKISIKLENFKFMLQHHKRLFAYDIFVHNHCELFKYENQNLNISYRIQPLRNQDLKYLKNYDKIFVAFCRRDSSAFCDPIVISLPNDTTIGEMKKSIFKKFKRIKATQYIEYSKIKFYVYTLVDYKPHKDNLLINSKDEEKISQFFKRGARNVLVELLQLESETSGKELKMG